MHGNQKQALWAYVAGIMDADGCFMIVKQSRGHEAKKDGIVNPSHMPALKISMIEEGAVSFIVQELGFGIYKLEGVRKSRITSKPLYTWYLRKKKDVIVFIENIYPHLRVKMKRAEHLLEFCKRMEKYTDKKHCKKLTQEELNYREESYWKMRELNGNKAAATTKP